MKSILVSRLRLLEAASRGSPGTIPRPEKLPMAPPRPSPVHQRVRRRYFQELTAVREELGESSQSSEDENYPGTVDAESFESPVLKLKVHFICYNAKSKTVELLELKKFTYMFCF